MGGDTFNSRFYFIHPSRPFSSWVAVVLVRTAAGFTGVGFILIILLLLFMGSWRVSLYILGLGGNWMQACSVLAAKVGAPRKVRRSFVRP